MVREGLRLVQERDAKLRGLQAMLEASIARGGENTDDDAGRLLDRREAELAKAGL